VAKVIRHGEGGGPDVEHGCDPFELMVTSFVEVVAEPDDACSLTREISRQPRCAAAENAGYGVEFFSTILQIGASDHKIRGAECGDRRKQSPIFVVPKPVGAWRFWQGIGHNRGNDDRRSGHIAEIRCTGVNRSGIKWAIIKSCYRYGLSKAGPAEGGHHEKALSHPTNHCR
jgi:hypothetical protein